MFRQLPKTPDPGADNPFTTALVPKPGEWWEFRAVFADESVPWDLVRIGADGAYPKCARRPRSPCYYCDAIPCECKRGGENADTHFEATGERFVVLGSKRDIIDELGDEK